MEDWNADLSYEYYREMLYMISSNFTIQRLATYSTSNSSKASDSGITYLRHDIDVSIQSAVALARVEAECDVASTYMVMPETPLYNIEDEAESLHQLIDLGHEVGLHYPLEKEKNKNTPGLTADEITEIKAAKQRLEDVISQGVNSISFHRPTERVLRGPVTIAGMVNAYSEELMSYYISDSRGRWREGDPIENIDSARDEDVLQILTHPIWWGESHKEPINRLSAFTQDLASIDRGTYEYLIAVFPEIESVVVPNE